ncbi:MAG TPA: pentapeptide repeat-containing protein [Thermoanaerobaculia bacterium]|nr:pentapeptide repeat-containing protein [Thermoanaerobaculia bacterium]
MTSKSPIFALLTICLLVPLSSLAPSPGHAAGRSVGEVPASLMELDGRDLRGLDLRGWDLRYADLDGADLSGADLSGARLVGASLRGARLDGATLRGADLRLADLVGVSLREADLREADLSAAQVAPVAIDGAQWSGAICPDDTIAGDAACRAASPEVALCADLLRPLPAASSPDPRSAL